MITLKRTSSDDLDFRELVVLLDQNLHEKDGDEHLFYAQFNKIDRIKEVVVAFIEDTAVGCGAFKVYDKTTVEIKRMFVKPDHRGQGIAQHILKELETWALESGYPVCILETGKRQPEAIRLYQKAGYTSIPNYGQYKNVENSVCMKKPLLVVGI